MNLDTSDITVPHLDQYFGVWAILEDVFRAAVNRVNGLDLSAHVEAQQAASRTLSYKYPLEKGVAVISLVGPLMKYVSSLSGGTSTVWARRVLRSALDDDKVRAILLRIDSPGGTVAGTRDLADDVAAAALCKPTYAYIEDFGASAAYWIASQTSRIYSNSTALVGAIGTFAVLQDMSGMAAKLGVKVHVVRAGAMKGMGTPGTEVTHEHLEEVQRIVDELNEQFLSAIASGRAMSPEKVQNMADGRVHVGSAAQSLGLIDGIRTYEQTLADLESTYTSKKSRAQAASASKETKQMTEENTTVATEETATQQEPKLATIAELKAAFPDSDAEFREKCLETGKTLTQAKDEWLVHMREKNEEMASKMESLTEENEKLKQEQKKSADDGADAVGFKGDGTGTAGTGREAVIQNARKAFASEAAQKTVLCSEEAWVNTALRDADKPRLREEELVQHDISGR